METVYRGTRQFSKSFGKGLYCRFSMDLAREYGQINKYEINFDGLSVLDLRENIMDWMAVVTHNRDIKLRDCIFKFPHVDLSTYDVVIGYRTDNSYMTALKQCLDGTITRTRLKDIISKDERNIEICLKSSRAKGRLEFKRVISKDMAKAIDDIQTRKMLNVSESYVYDLTKLLSEYFACCIEQKMSYDDAYNILIDSGIYKLLKGRFVAGTFGCDLFELCTGISYKNLKIDHSDFWLANTISRYIIDNGYVLDIFRNRCITMEQLLTRQDDSLVALV